MSRADELRAELAVAELEDELRALKEGGGSRRLAEVKAELRYQRWVARGGPAAQEAGIGNRATDALYDRWLSEKG